MSAVRARVSLLASLAVLVSVLSGCGLAGTSFRPGIAAAVGDRTLTVRDADETTKHYCEAIEEDLSQQGQRIPMRFLASEVVAKLAVVLAVDQLAEEYGVEPSAQYRSELSTLRAQASSAEEEAADAFVEVGSAVPYYRDILTSVGRIVLERQGNEDASSEEQFDAGRTELTRWMDEHDIEFNPLYGLAIEDGLPVQQITDTSYAFSEQAKAGQATVPAPEYAADLPDRLVCG